MNPHYSPSKRTDRKIAQPQVAETALLPQPEQSPVKTLTERVVAALDRDADAFAEVAAFDKRAAAKGTAILRIRAVQPEGQRNTVAEQKIDFALAERIAG